MRSSARRALAAASPLQPGGRLYQVLDWTANAAVTYTLPLSGNLNLVNNPTCSYVADSKSANNDSFGPRTRSPYSLLDARLALCFREFELALVGKNLPNEHANLADNRSIALEPGRPRMFTKQPITIGIEFRATFK